MYFFKWKNHVRPKLFKPDGRRLRRSAARDQVFIFGRFFEGSWELGLDITRLRSVLIFSTMCVPNHRLCSRSSGTGSQDTAGGRRLSGCGGLRMANLLFADDVSSASSDRSHSRPIMHWGVSQHLQVRGSVLCQITFGCSLQAGNELLPRVKEFKYQRSVFWKLQQTMGILFGRRNSNKTLEIAQTDWLKKT